MLRRLLTPLLPLALLMHTASPTFAQGTAFTYQGRLSNAGNPASGPHDMQFKLYDTVDVGTGAQHGTTITNTTVQVTSGIFTVELDFGACASCFDGATRYLEISVRPAVSTVPYTVLSPRQPINSSPYAVRSLNAAAADGLSLACVNCVTSTQIQSVEAAQITGEISTATEYRIGGNTVLSLGASGSRPVGGGIDNLFAGVLAGEANTTGSQNSFFGTSAGSGNTTGSDNSYFGAYTAQAPSTASANSFFGVSAGFNNIGTANSFFGRSAGFQNTTGFDNSFFGVQAGRDSSTGSQNSFFGRAAGIGNSSGFDNSYFGAYTAQALSTGSANSFFGVSAGFNNTGTANSFFGRSAGFQNTTGDSNSFFGVQAGRDNSAGASNSFFGRAAGISNGTGTGNTIIGANANVSAGNLTNAIAIGSNTIVSQSNSLILGNNVNVGIGTSSPQFKLHIEAAGIVESNVRSTNERAILALDSMVGGQRRVWTLESGIFGTPGLFGIYDRTASLARLTIDATGLVGVKALQIQGGADFSENFDVSEANGTKAGAVSKEVVRGFVVSIDVENPGKLVVSRRAYDRSVAGIISGAGGISPGLVMGQHGSIADGKHPVALTGRVWAYCDAGKYAIKPGDLLTTSVTPGHAMKVIDYRKAQGAIIGKAMTGLKSGRGLVLVLVSLQ